MTRGLLQTLLAASPFRGRMSGPNARALKAWIAANMPELDRELGPLTLDQVRMRLNEITGCAIGPAERIEDGCAQFLAALQAQHAARKEAP